MSKHPFGVIFDMDGVLCDSAQAHFESWGVVTERWGARMTPETFARTFGQTSAQIIPQILGRMPTPEEIEHISEAKEESYRRIIAGSLEPLPGVVALIDDLARNGFSLAIGSSGPRENIDLVLATLGVADRFSHVVSGADVTVGKPAPEVFLWAAEGIGVPPGRCLVIEDASVGIEAAHAAGMKCLAVATTHDASLLTAADVVREGLEGFTARQARELIEG